MPLQTTNQIALAHGVKCIVYGPSGVGKTRLVATAPSPLLISAESGLLSLRGFEIPVYPVTSLETLTAAYNWLAQSAEAKQYLTICVDSITEIAEVCLSDAKTRFKDPRSAYGDLIDRMTLILKSFRDLPNKHVYMSAKLERYVDGVNGSIFHQPMMPGKQLGPALPYLFDEVFHMGIAKDAEGKDYRYLRTALDFQYEAGDRSGKLDPFEKPDLTYIFNKIAGEIT